MSCVSVLYVFERRCTDSGNKFPWKFESFYNCITKMVQRIVTIVPNPHICIIIYSTCQMFSPNIKLLTSYKYLYPSSPVTLNVPLGTGGMNIWLGSARSSLAFWLLQSVFPHCKSAVQSHWEYMTSAPEDGAVIYGLFMEGKILWNYTFLDNGT